MGLLGSFKETKSVRSGYLSAGFLMTGWAVVVVSRGPGPVTLGAWGGWASWAPSPAPPPGSWN